ncbi:MAG: RidA family protein [Pseudomonadota bacterium]
MKCFNGSTHRIVAGLFSIVIAAIVPQEFAMAQELKEAPDQIEKNGCLHGDPEQNLQDLGIVLPTPAAPIANFVPVVRVGKLLYLSGNGPRLANGSFITGKLGLNPGQLSVDVGYDAARITAINQLGVLKAELGDLKRVKRIVKLFGMVNSDQNFTDQPKVINGASDLLVSVFGECGKHARSAVGMAALPFNTAVEIDMVVEVR